MTLAAERLLEQDPPPCPVLLAPPLGWPAHPGPAAYHGLIGEIVRQLEPETEADPVAILTQLLVAFGTAVGRGAYFEIEATRHHPHEFLLLVGESSRARKGTAWDHVRRLICEADPTLSGRILTGLSSGDYLPRPIICSGLGFPCSGRGACRFTSDNQSWSRNAITASLGWYRPGAVPVGVMRSIASCLIVLSACR
jgi:hypothetical protein